VFVGLSLVLVFVLGFLLEMDLYCFFRVSDGYFSWFCGFCRRLFF